MIRRTLLCALITSACTSAPKPAEISYSDNRTPVRKIADSTRVLVRLGVEQADTASLRAQLAAAERSPLRVRGFVTDARMSASTATESFMQAIEKGDRLQQIMTGGGGADDAPARYAKYWLTSRTKLDAARTRSHLAKQAADSALGCAAIPCSSAMANVLRNHMLAAAGNAHEAESLVRIAMTYVP